jgi:acyl dehydratase
MATPGFSDAASNNSGCPGQPRRSASGAGLRQSKSRPGWGIVILPSGLVNQHGQVVQKGEHRLMILLRGI